MNSNGRLFPPKWGNLYYTQTKLRQCITDNLVQISNGTSNNLQVLDAGCGSKPYAEIIAKLGCKYFGIDVSMVPNTDGIISDSGKFNMPESNFDIVLSTQVLEHVEYVQNYLSECRNSLKDNGYIILSTHGHWIYHPDPSDYWRWTSDGLKKIVEESGFEVVKFNGVLCVSAFCMQVIQDKLNGRLKWKYLRAVNNSLFQNLIIPFLDKLSSDDERSKDASIFVLVAKKR